MNCQECESLFDEMIDRRVKEPTRQRIELHLLRCETCRSRLEHRKKSHTLMFRALNGADVRLHLPKGFADRLVAECRSQPKRSFFPALPRWALIAASLAIVAGFALPGFPLAGSLLLSMLFSFGSLMIILTMAYSMDRSLSTHTVILIGVIFSMLASALLSLLVAFAGEKLKSVTFWMMGSLSGKNMQHVLILAAALLLFGGTLLFHARELNHFALGEENARRVGVAVRKVKLIILIAASALIGVCVAVGGSIAFVGLIVPHMVRMVTGPNHRKLMPVSLFAGAVFLMFTDLLARTVLSPVELPIGVVTSLIGAVTFAVIFRNSRKGGKRRAAG